MSRRAASPSRPRRKPHVFRAAEHRDWKDREVCGHNGCGQLRRAACHDMPEPDPEVTAEEARRLGERTEP